MAVATATATPATVMRKRTPNRFARAVVMSSSVSRLAVEPFI
jgi:hypothetical protein